MKTYESIRDLAKSTTVSGLLRIFPRLSDESILKIAHNELKKIPYAEGREFMGRVLLQAKTVLKEACPSCRKRIWENLIANNIVKSSKARDAFRKEYGFDPPGTLVLNPSMRCNLRCYGCYTAGFAKDDDMNEELVYRILDEAKHMGIYFVVISGGEPFFSKILFRMFEKYNDMFFQVYTNGTLLDEETVRKLCKVGNVMPCISVEGFEKETDSRRGEGTFAKIVGAMDLLRKHDALFGFSATATRENNELIVSDEFIDFFVKKGCRIGWYFQYIPVGREPNLDLVPTPEQRIARGQKLRDARKRYSIALADFWNDGALVGGCIAGGRAYLNIAVNGDVEACAFAHFAIDNIKDKSLAEVLQSDYFKAIRERQPFNENLLRPCMIIDHPSVLRELAVIRGVHPTHAGAETILDSLADGVDKIAEEYGKLADREWDISYVPHSNETARE